MCDSSSFLGSLGGSVGDLRGRRSLGVDDDALMGHALREDEVSRESGVYELVSRRRYDGGPCAEADSAIVTVAMGAGRMGRQ